MCETLECPNGSADEIVAGVHHGVQSWGAQTCCLLKCCCVQGYYGVRGDDPPVQPLPVPSNPGRALWPYGKCVVGSYLHFHFQGEETHFNWFMKNKQTNKEKSVFIWLNGKVWEWSSLQENHWSSPTLTCLHSGFICRIHVVAKGVLAASTLMLVSLCLFWLWYALSPCPLPVYSREMMLWWASPGHAVSQL